MTHEQLVELLDDEPLDPLIFLALADLCEERGENNLAMAWRAIERIRPYPEYGTGWLYSVNGPYRRPNYFVVDMATWGLLRFHCQAQQRSGAWADLAQAWAANPAGIPVGEVKILGYWPEGISE